MDRYYKKRFVPLALPALILFISVIVGKSSATGLYSN